MNRVSRWGVSFHGGVALLVLLLAVGGCGNDGAVAPDTDAPVITSAPSVTVTENTATVTWSTDEEATSVVHYGTTPSYGSSESSGGTLGAPGFVANHSVTITGLDPFTDYHYSVECSDAAGNQTSSSDALFTTDRSFSQYIEQGWNSFESGDYQTASASFASACEKHGTSVEAWVGKGWSDLYLVDFDASLSAFGTALGLDATDRDAMAGRAFASVEDGMYTQASSDCSDLLAESSTYTFSHYTSFNELDVHCILAAAYYYAGSYTQAQAQVDILDPSNGLDSGSPSYLSDLESAITRLYSLFVYDDAGAGGGKTPTTQPQGA